MKFEDIVGKERNEQIDRRVNQIVGGKQIIDNEIRQSKDGYYLVAYKLPHGTNRMKPGHKLSDPSGYVFRDGGKRIKGPVTVRWVGKEYDEKWEEVNFQASQLGMEKIPTGQRSAVPCRRIYIEIEAA